MWYLVVPPIVVVLSFFFLLWYLSRKGTDPLVAQRVLEGKEEQRVLFSGVKEFFLRLVEKSAQRFKVGLLRAHNASNEFAQSVKRMRTKIETLAPTETGEKRPTSLVQANDSVRNSKQPDPEQSSPQAEDRPYDILQAPIARKERVTVVTKNSTSGPEQKAIVPRPTVSDTVAHPEIKKNVGHDERLKEEALIARIARDPKDFTAYEALGDHYLEIGNIKDAKECYRQVLKLSPVHRLVKIKIRRLEKLLTRGGE